MSPKISVIMSVYGESLDQLQKSIDSILHQSFTDFEFVIVLDKPENTSAKNYILERRNSDARIVFLENSENIKLWASLNRWIKIAKWDYIARMDGDDICDITKLQKQYSYLEEHSQIDLLFSWWEEIDEQWDSNIRIPSKKNFQNIEKTFFYKSPILHASMMCKRSIFERYRYPEMDRPEDFALFLQLIAAWYSFDILEENLYSFYIQTYDLDTKYKKIRTFSSNFLKILLSNTWVYWKNIYFWWMFSVVIIEWLLSRNKTIFKIFFGWLQQMYKKIFL